MRLSVSGEDSLRSHLLNSLAAYAQLGSKRLLRKAGSFTAIDEALCHRKIHGGSFRLMVESNEPSMPRTTGSDHHF